MKEANVKLSFNDWVKKLSENPDNKKENQILVFEEIVMQIVKWWKDSNPGKDFEKDNNLSTLKVLKLHFFVCAVGTTKNEPSPLLDMFNFYAMPYGHVCGDIYQHIKNTRGKFSKFTLSNKGIVLN